MELFRKCFGGGVSAENSSLESAATIENGSSTFNNNLAYIGGGISARINSHVSFRLFSLETQQHVVWRHQHRGINCRGP